MRYDMGPNRPRTMRGERALGNAIIKAMGGAGGKTPKSTDGLGGNLGVRAKNQIVVLQALADHGPLHLSGLVRLTGRSLDATCTYMRDAIKDGRVTAVVMSGKKVCTITEKGRASLT